MKEDPKVLSGTAEPCLFDGAPVVPVGLNISDNEFPSVKTLGYVRSTVNTYVTADALLGWRSVTAAPAGPVRWAERLLLKVFLPDSRFSNRGRLLHADLPHV